MLQETKFTIENLSKPLIDIDVSQSNSRVYITGYLKAVELSMRNIPFGTHIHFNDKSYNLPGELRFPIVRSINEETALVIGWSEIKENAWIISSSGEIKSNFSIDHRIQDLIITKNFIVITEFDEGAIGGDGVCIYDFKGNRLFNYHEIFGSDSVDIADCYAATLVKNNQIIFCPYTDFPMIFFDIDNKSQLIWEIPETVHGSDAITSRGKSFYFHSPYSSESGIYEWQIGSKTAQKIGESRYHLRGLPDGQFFAITKSGYAIISIR